MHVTGNTAFVVHVGGTTHPAGVSPVFGGKMLVHPSGKVAFEKVVLNCDPPRICADADVSAAVPWDRSFTPEIPIFTVFSRAAVIPLVCIAFALAPPTVGCMKYAKMVASAAHPDPDWEHSAVNPGGMVKLVRQNWEIHSPGWPPA